MNYPYLFQTSGFAVIDKIRAELESQREWDFVKDTDQATSTIETAAARFGFSLPFTDEQSKLSSYLKSKLAGTHMCTYAWGLYAEFLGKEMPEKQYA